MINVGGYLGYHGVVQYCEGIMSTMEDILSIMEDTQYHGGIS